MKQPPLQFARDAFARAFQPTITTHPNHPDCKFDVLIGYARIEPKSAPPRYGKEGK